MPVPFSRELSFTNVSTDAMSGNDVLIMETLLKRSPLILNSSLNVNGLFDESDATAVSAFQSGTPGLSPATGVFDNATASALLGCCMQDGYEDDGTSARSLGMLYKIVVPLPSANRSVETSATLFDADNNAIMSFVVRTHGNREGGSMPWPDYGDGDYGTNALSSNGNTPTGLMYVDLNSPEPTDYEAEYG
eukprot:CAMPEP_0119524508 /NCGR_PEP_ID=MMETSP1344-20130328/39436_1 /TAXON_ID=236787 /ORGANISM="Florenciella parvula, Strain CCMP2471" /LENGTH=190 /DNA_ID=CAMNT_0007563031 /DNA_START=113 /DNA_END=681 /DNA_ORIENTATION=-